MTIVIDASIALAWCFEDEASDETDAVAQDVIASGGLVPSLFHLEFANVLLQAERRGRISASEIAQRLDLITQMPIETDLQTVGRAWSETLSLARAHKLTSYDAAYLELASRKGALLATKKTRRLLQRRTRLVLSSEVRRPSYGIGILWPFTRPR